MDNTRIYYLVERYLQKHLDDEEAKEFNKILQSAEHQAELSAAFDNLVGTMQMDIAMDESLAQIPKRIFEADKLGAAPYQQEIYPVSKARVIKTGWLRYAAAIILLFSAVAYFWKTNHQQNRLAKNTASSHQTDVQPGGNKAVLLLSDGRSITLDEAKNGALTEDGNYNIVKSSDSLIQYLTAGKNIAAEGYNTMSTPKGGQYQVRLPDGTKVWLNAASSIRFPISFNKRERKVNITGEVYFEVAKNKTQPFIVEINEKTQVQVLGTNFNVNAYDDEDALNTTLLDGSVKVIHNGVGKILVPGQQASVKKDNSLSVTDGVDMEEIMAWKNGYFHFDDTELKTVIRQLGRWYDVQVRFEGNVGKERVRAIIPRDISFSKLMHKLSLTGKIHYKIEDKTITITQ